MEQLWDTVRVYWKGGSLLNCCSYGEGWRDRRGLAWTCNCGHRSSWVSEARTGEKADGLSRKRVYRVVRAHSLYLRSLSWYNSQIRWIFCRFICASLQHFSHQHVQEIWLFCVPQNHRVLFGPGRWGGRIRYVWKYWFCSWSCSVVDMRKALPRDIDKKSIIPLPHPVTTDEL